ncbi:MAG: transposase [Candidatus Melainabacteria bacterium]|nr:MAG: transposase [Candidatus Melainabacteria bacterium]
MSKKVILDSGEDIGSIHSRFHSRGYLPHCEFSLEPQMLTFNLHDSIPQPVLTVLTEELDILRRLEQQTKRCTKIEDLLDRGLGSCALSDPSIAQITEQAMGFFDEQRYKLHAWVIMPNHVHVLLTPKKEHSIASIVHSWKSFTSNRANKILGRSGAFWQREYFDRKIRNDKHFEDALNYIHNNPVKAGLCVSPELWMFSSASASSKLREDAKK